MIDRPSLSNQRSPEGDLLPIIYVVVGIMYLGFSILVLFDIGQWSGVRYTMPTPWRLTLGIVWAIGGCVLLVAGVLQKVTEFVWTPIVAGSAILAYFLGKARRGAERV